MAAGKLVAAFGKVRAVAEKLMAAAEKLMAGAGKVDAAHVRLRLGGESYMAKTGNFIDLDTNYMLQLLT